MKKQKKAKPENSENTDIDLSTRGVTKVNMFEKFKRALEMDRKGTPRSTIYTELDISSATFYKWINNPKYWADKYKTTPEKLMRTTKEIIQSVKQKETSFETIKSLMKDLGLNDYELEFMYHYIQKRNSTEALLSCLPPDKEITRQTAKIKALKMMQRNNIREGINRVMQWELEGIQMTLANDVVSQLYRMAFYDPAMFIKIENGVVMSRFKSLDDVPPEYRCCVLGMKNTFHPKDANKVYVEIKLADKKAAMRELMDYANLYESNNSGAHALGEGLKKIADLLDKNKIDAVDLTARKITPVKKSS